jgi:hypothetical protein
LIIIKSPCSTGPKREGLPRRQEHLTLSQSRSASDTIREGKLEQIHTVAVVIMSPKRLGIIDLSQREPIFHAETKLLQ